MSRLFGAEAGGYMHCNCDHTRGCLSAVLRLARCETLELGFFFDQALECLEHLIELVRFMQEILDSGLFNL